MIIKASESDWNRVGELQGYLSKMSKCGAYVQVFNIKPPLDYQQTTNRKNVLTCMVSEWKRKLLCHPSAHSSRVLVFRHHICMVVDASVTQGIVISVLGVCAGIGFLIWVERQGDRSQQRTNSQPCVVCNGNKRIACAICKGTGKNVVAKRLDEVCYICKGAGKVTCNNCAGSGIQPRYLDRYSPEDFMD
eukprot:jgi/Galph1/5272/GphlegSOOS_G3935.1